jgi:hypothetical protein
MDSNDLVVGAWRNGLNATTAGFVEAAEKQRAQGFRLLPLASTVVELCDLLDSYDNVGEELLLNERTKGK